MCWLVSLSRCGCNHITISITRPTRQQAPKTHTHCVTVPWRGAGCWCRPGARGGRRPAAGPPVLWLWLLWGVRRSVGCVRKEEGVGGGCPVRAGQRVTRSAIPNHPGHKHTQHSNDSPASAPPGAPPCGPPRPSASRGVAPCVVRVCVCVGLIASCGVGGWVWVEERDTRGHQHSGQQPAARAPAPTPTNEPIPSNPSTHR